MAGVETPLIQNIKPALIYNIIARCSKTKARVGKMILPHGEVDTPVFMIVGTQVWISSRFQSPP